MALLTKDTASPSTTTITSPDQVAIAEARLVTLAANVADLDGDIERLVEQRGNALAGVEIGQGGASERADKVGSQLIQVRSRRTDLDSISRALRAGIARYHLDVASQRAESAKVELVALAREARALEADFAEAMTRAGQAGRRLNLLTPKMARLRHTIHVGGGVPDPSPLPLRPRHLSLEILRDPVGSLQRWATRPTRRPGGPPRLNVGTGDLPDTPGQTYRYGE